MEFYKESFKFFENMGNIGALLTAKVGDKSNTMTISWGGIMVMWNKPIIVVPVRKTRYTYDFIEKAKGFSISMVKPENKPLLSFFGTKSGRDMDKYKEAGVTVSPCRAIDGDVVDNCKYYFECEKICKLDIEKDGLPEALDKSIYASGDYHTLYFGEIKLAYSK